MIDAMTPIADGTQTRETAKRIMSRRPRRLVGDLKSLLSCAFPRATSNSDKNESSR